MLTSIDFKFIFDSARLGLFSSASILQIADIALRVDFLLFKDVQTIAKIVLISYISILQSCLLNSKEYKFCTSLHITEKYDGSLAIFVLLH